MSELERCACVCAGVYKADYMALYYVRGCIYSATTQVCILISLTNTSFHNYFNQLVSCGGGVLEESCRSSL